MDFVSQIWYYLAPVFIVLWLLYRKRYEIKVPALGPTGPIVSWLGIVRVVREPRALLLEGYRKYPVFKIAGPFRWHVLVCDPKLVEEVRVAKEDSLSFVEAIGDLLAAEQTMGRSLKHTADRYHLPIIRTQLTRNIAAQFADIKTEVDLAFKKLIPTKPDGEWVEIPALPFGLKTVAQATNRVLVGEDLCRNTEWQDLAIRFTTDVSKDSMKLSIIPTLFRPLVSRFFLNFENNVQKAMKHLRPIIERHRAEVAAKGSEYEGKPNTFLSWMIDTAQGEEQSIRALTIRMLNIEFASIHTTSFSFIHALYHLAARSEYAEPMRAEVRSAISECGWSKAAMMRCHKLDSFLKESQRLNVALTRKTIKPFVFSNGTYLPAGTILSVPAVAIHADSTHYNDPEEFDGFRFVTREDEKELTKHQMVATSSEYLSFGHGRQACPGRFFASNELKLLTASVLIKYDVQFRSGERPPDEYLGMSCIPNRKGQVMFGERSS